MLFNVLSLICLAIITNAAVVKRDEPKVIRMDVKQGVSELVKRGDATGSLRIDTGLFILMLI